MRLGTLSNDAKTQLRRLFSKHPYPLRTGLVLIAETGLTPIEVTRLGWADVVKAPAPVGFYKACRTLYGVALSYDARSEINSCWVHHKAVKGIGHADYLLTRSRRGSVVLPETLDGLVRRAIRELIDVELSGAELAELIRVSRSETVAA